MAYPILLRYCDLTERQEKAIADAVYCLPVRSSGERRETPDRKEIIYSAWLTKVSEKISSGMTDLSVTPRSTTWRASSIFLYLMNIF